MTSLDKFRDDMATSLPTAASEYDSLAARRHACEPAVVGSSSSEVCLEVNTVEGPTLLE